MFPDDDDDDNDTVMQSLNCKKSVIYFSILYLCTVKISGMFMYNFETRSQTLMIRIMIYRFVEMVH
jgi:hypothetical protein